MNYQKEIIGNLIEYLVDGDSDSTSVDWYDGVAFPAASINGKRFQFIRKYEDVETITDNSIIPVLLVTTPEMYMNGRILYKGKYQDLKTFLITDKRSSSKIRFFVVPQVKTIQGNFLGTLTYNISIDYISQYDPYGFIADEINQIIKLLYYKKRSGNYYHFDVEGKQFFFVPNTITPIDSGAILNRIYHTYSVRACHFG